MALKNKNFCRPSDEGRSIEYAPVVLSPSPHAPTESEYNAAGWYRNEVVPPQPPEGKMVASATYAVDQETNSVKAQYVYEDAPAPVRTFSKLQLETALFQEGLLEAVDAFIDMQMIANEHGQTMPLRRMYNTANEFRSDNRYFHDFLAALKSELGISDEVADRILAAGEISG